MSGQKRGVGVVVRVRPTAQFAHGALMVDTDRHTVDLKLDATHDDVVNNQVNNFSFKYHKVLLNASQDTVYEQCAHEVVEQAFKGINGTIMAYGQTGAGKTFTMVGGTQSFEHRGIIPRAITSLFDMIYSRTDMSYNVKVSYMEIYNEQMFDLLDNVGQSDHLQIIDDHVGGVKVKGLTMVGVSDEQDVLNHFFNGENNRAVAQHSLNDESSRSHAIFTVHLEARSKIESAERITISKLNLVDLAGSERVKKTDTEGAGLEEAKFINRSLTYLEQCVVAASDKNRDHIPFRQTRLTNILRDSIGGNCATLLIANIWGEKHHLDETLSTCRFAQRMMRVQNTPSAKVHQDPALLLKKYEREIRQLKQELAMHDTLSGRNRKGQQPVYDEYDDEQRAGLRSEVEEYLEGKKEDMELTTLRQMREILGCTRHIFREMKTKVEDEFKRKYDLTAKGEGTESQAASPKREAGSQGEEETGADGFAAGKAPDGAAPPVSPTIGSPKSIGDDETYADEAGLSETKPMATQVVQMRKRIPRAEAYEVFKSEDGTEWNQAVVDDSNQLIEYKRQAKTLGDKVNNDKYEIDRLKDLIARKTRERSSEEVSEDGTMVIDEEEYAAMTELKKRKTSYRDSFEKLRATKHKLTDLTAAVQSNKERLLEEFDRWYVMTYGEEPREAVKEENSGPVYGPGGDLLDPDEAFEKLEVERIMEDNPKSFAFTQASKHKVAMKGTLAAGRSQGAAMRARNRKG